MSIYICNNCGGQYDRRDMKWTDRIYDEKCLDGRLFPVCPSCGSDDIDVGEICEYCETDIANEWLGDIQLCERCKKRILDDIEKCLDEYAEDRRVSYATAKDWFIGWAEERW